MLIRMKRLAAKLIRLPLTIVGEVTERVLDTISPPEPFEYQYSTTPTEDHLRCP